MKWMEKDIGLLVTYQTLHYSEIKVGKIVNDWFIETEAIALKNSKFTNFTKQLLHQLS